MYVADVLFRCCVCFSGYIHILQAFIQNIHLFHTMLQVFSPDVANVSPVSDVCCRSASCCNISRRRKQTQEAIPTGAAKRSGCGWSPPTCALAGTMPTTAYVGAPACGGGCAGAAVACEGTRACGAGGAGLAACLTCRTGTGVCTGG
jgi:hypothetical protein